MTAMCPSFEGRPGFPQGLSVLLMEDDRETLQNGAELLRSCNYEVTLATSRADALRVLRASRIDDFDVALLSGRGAGTSQGQKVLDAARAKQLPVVLIGEREDHGFVLQGLKLGAVQVLSRPLARFHVSKLWYHAVRNAMRRKIVGVGGSGGPFSGIMRNPAAVKANGGSNNSVTKDSTLKVASKQFGGGLSRHHAGVIKGNTAAAAAAKDATMMDIEPFSVGGNAVAISDAELALIEADLDSLFPDVPSDRMFAGGNKGLKESADIGPLDIGMSLDSKQQQQQQGTAAERTLSSVSNGESQMNNNLWGANDNNGSFPQRSRTPPARACSQPQMQRQTHSMMDMNSMAAQAVRSTINRSYNDMTQVERINKSNGAGFSGATPAQDPWGCPILPEVAAQCKALASRQASFSTQGNRDSSDNLLGVSMAESWPPPMPLPKIGSKEEIAQMSSLGLSLKKSPSLVSLISEGLGGNSQGVSVK